MKQNDLLQLMISTMEDRLNEHNEEEHKINGRKG